MSSLRVLVRRRITERFGAFSASDFDAFADPGSRANRRLIALIGGSECILASGLIFLFGLPYANRIGTSFVTICLIVVLATALGLFLLRIADSASMAAVDVCIVLGGLVVCVVMLTVNGEVSSIVVVGFVWSTVPVFAFRTTRAAVAHTIAIGVAYAAVLVIEAPVEVPVLRWFSLVVALVTIGGTQAWLIGRARRLAVAERDAREAAEQASSDLAEVSSQKSRFLATMSHELRTPLNAIIGFSEVLERRIFGPLNERQGRYVTDIVESGRHLLALIDDILDLAKVETGGVEVHPVEVSLRTVLEHSLTMVRDRAERHDIELELYVSAATGTVFADERKLKQVVVNLLSNAVKFTEPGGIVHLRAGRVDGVVQVSVIDSGPGIAPADQERIFEEFDQGGTRRADAHEGTGLGLALARQFVELHGGRLWVESTPGRGSVFNFTLPAPARRRDRSSPLDLRGAEEQQAPVRSWRRGDPLVPVPTIARLGAMIAFEGAAAAGLGALFVHAPGFDNRVAALGALLSIVFGTCILVMARRVPLWLVDVGEVAGIVAISIGVANAGPLRAYATLLYVMLIALTFACRARGVALLYCALVGVCYAFVLAVQPGNDAPMAELVVLLVTLGMSGSLVSWLLERTGSIGAAERVAREDAERLSMELAEASRHKTAFLAGMSHELRTPLNAIIGFSEVLDRGIFGELNEQQGQYVTDIVDSGRHLLELINDILDLAKVEAGRIDLDPVEVHVHVALDAALSAVRERAEREGVELELDVADDAGMVSADERKLKQLVVNLLSNAVKFTPAGGRVTLRARRVVGGVEVSVSDTGPGIAPADRDRIFEPFQQAENDPTRAREGTGLGLALARQFVELHGGRLCVDPASRQGATFTFTLPDEPEPTHPSDTVDAVAAR